MESTEKILIENNDFRQDSRKVNHPTRLWYMETAKHCIDVVNAMEDKNGVSFALKFMIQCGLSTDLDGVWRISELSSELQHIVISSLDNFNGFYPVEQ